MGFEIWGSELRVEGKRFRGVLRRFRMQERSMEFCRISSEESGEGLEKVWEGLNPPWSFPKIYGGFKDFWGRVWGWFREN